MHVDKFHNYLLSLLLTLQLIGYILIFAVWANYGTRGLIFSMIMFFLLCSLSIYYLQKIRVYNDKGKEQNLSDIFSDTVILVWWLVISTIIGIIVGALVGYSLAKEYNKSRIVGLLIPLIVSGILLISLASVAEA